MLKILIPDLHHRKNSILYNVKFDHLITSADLIPLNNNIDTIFRHLLEHNNEDSNQNSDNDVSIIAEKNCCNEISPYFNNYQSWIPYIFQRYSFNQRHRY